MGSTKEIKKEHWREELVPCVTEEQTQEENLKCVKAWKLQKERKIQEEKIGDFKDKKDVTVLEKG